VPVDSSGYGSTGAVRHAYQSTRPNIAVIASPRIKVVIDGNSSLSTLPPSRWPRASERKSLQHLLKPLLEGHGYHPETEKYHQTSSHRRARRCQRWRFVGAETTRSTNAVFWEMPGDLLGDASKHDNAPAFKHCQMRAPNSSCGVDPPMKAASQVVVKQSEPLAFPD
jgi:hypothetical protein